MLGRKKNTKINWKNVSEPAKRRSWLGRLISWSLVAVIWGTLGLAAMVGWYAYDLPNITALVESGRQPSITLAVELVSTVTVSPAASNTSTVAATTTARRHERDTICRARITRCTAAPGTESTR